MIGGLFGDSREFAESLARADRQPRPSEDHDLDSVIARGVRALTEEVRELDETEIDALLCESLEKRYADFMRESTRKTPRTVQLYTSTFKSFHKWAVDCGVSSLPARIGVVASYLDEQVLAGASQSKIERIISAVSYAHRVADKFDPTDNELVRAIKHAAKVKEGKRRGKN